MKNLVAILGFITLFVSCYIQQRSPRNSNGHINYKNNDRIVTRIKLFHFNSDSTRIYFSFDARKQDYYLLSDKSKYRASFNFSYELYNNDGGKKVKLDSTTLRLVDLQNTPVAKTITGYLEISTKTGTNFLLKIILWNKDNNAEYENNFRIEKKSCIVPEYFLITNLRKIPLLDKNFTDDEGLVSVCKSCEEIPKLYKVIGGIDLPSPPFSGDNFSAQNNYETFQTTLSVEGKNRYSFSKLEKGFYILEISPNNGLSFYHFTKWYPLCDDTSQFFEPLVFLTSKTEYAEFEEDESKVKNLFEKFWIDRAGSKEKARIAIREYFKRVFDANGEYTSVKEGWKTDRGMISIIFGKPWKTEKNLNRETWIYRTAFNSSLSFIFEKVDNPYTNNDYRLVRDLRYKPQWYNAVENWRNGRPFNLNGS